MSTESALRTRLRSALLDARRVRYAVATSTLRTVLAALENAEAVPMSSVSAVGAIEESLRGVGATDAARHVLSDDDELAILEAEIASLSEAAAAYDDIAPGRADAARAGIEVLTALR